MYRCLTILIFSLIPIISFAQQDSTASYKKRVLESTEIDILSSYYNQDGNNASVTGGIGSEELTNIAPNIIVTLPLNSDDILTIDFGISAYTSASSSNLDPADESPPGSPWVASSGASLHDIWGGLSIAYEHSSDDRNNLWNINASSSVETDYFSFGIGGGFSHYFNKKNTLLNVHAKIYLDTWRPRYPIEFEAYLDFNGDFNQGFFQYVNIYNQNGVTSSDWSPVSGFELIKDKSRNSFSVSFSLSQILSKKAQLALFLDLVLQKGWLANPMHRIYFADIENYYVGNSNSIPNYTSSSNTDAFQLADDIERLPHSRFKIPIGIRFNYYLNEVLSFRSYYRYYLDDWGINSHTASLELPIKIFQKFTLYPSYRYYNQTAADYFSPYETHLSTDEFFTADYDLSKFNASQFGFGISYSDTFAKLKLWKFGLKNIDFRYQNYKRNTGLKADSFALGFKFVDY